MGGKWVFRHYGFRACSRQITVLLSTLQCCTRFKNSSYSCHIICNFTIYFYKQQAVVMLFPYHIWVGDSVMRLAAIGCNIFSHNQLIIFACQKLFSVYQYFECSSKQRIIKRRSPTFKVAKQCFALYKTTQFWKKNLKFYTSFSSFLLSSTPHPLLETTAWWIYFEWF